MTIGTKPFPLAWLGLLTLAVSLCLAAAPKSAADAVVAGTVFRDPGFAFPNADVTVEAVALPPGVKKFKTVRQKSDARGEFAVHVPAGPGKYRVTARAEQFQMASKEVDVSGEERVDVYLTLKPEAPKE